MQTIIGKENIIQLLWNILGENKNGELHSILTSKPLVYYFGDEFAENFMQKRVENNINLKSLRLTEKCYDSEKHKNYTSYLKEIQHISTDEKFDFDTIFITKSKVILFYKDNMSAKIYESDEKIYQYMNFFEKYWDNK